MDEVARVLTNSVLCKGLNDAEVEELTKICTPIRFKSEEVIVAEDAHGRDLYIVKSGRAQINLSGPFVRDGVGAITKILPGQVVGELGFIDGARRSAWVVATEDVEAIKLGWEDFHQLTRSNSTIGYKFIYNVALVIAARLRDATMSLSNVLGLRSSE